MVHARSSRHMANFVFEAARRCLRGPPHCVLALLVLCSALGVAAPDLDQVVSLARSRYGEQAAETLGLWRRLLAGSAALDERAKLEAVNDFFNRNVRYEEDQLSWGQADYWATPLETLGRGQGDCEDFSIGKYVTLGMLGVPISKLRITYVRAELGIPGSGVSQAHMVLAYYDAPDAEPLVLDNLISELRPASRRPDLRPVFGFNSQGLWVAGQSGGPSMADPTARLSRWRDLLSRMQQEGLN
jgi:predicted transglutaminase-like cysteine proteinase